MISCERPMVGISQMFDVKVTHHSQLQYDLFILFIQVSEPAFFIMYSQNGR
jgi:hypothetical protein